jgi:ABC-type multidrug transport system fused ATPase/permease subunit
MTFLNSLSISKHEILDFIATIDFENFDVNDIIQSSIITTVYVPIILFYVFFIIFFAAYTTFRWCWCRDFNEMEKAFEPMFFIFILFSLISIVFLSLVINGNIKLIFGFIESIDALESIMDVFYNILNNNTQDCEFISNSSEFIEIRDQFDQINQTILDVEQIFYEYNPYYFATTHAVSAVLLTFVIFLAIIVIVQNYVEHPSIKPIRLTVEIILVIVLMMYTVSIPLLRVPSYGSSFLCSPNLVDNVIDIVDLLEENDVISNDIKQVVEFYFVCEDPDEKPNLLSEIGLLNTSFIDQFEDEGFGCSENNEIVCTDPILCGDFNLTDIPEEFEFLCSCNTFLNNIEELIYECSTIKNLIILVDNAVCGVVGESFAQTYVSSIVVVYSISISLVFYAIYEGIYYSNVYTKISLD